MKKIKKIFALLIAMVMVLGMSTSVFAAATADSGKGGRASIQITLPTDNAGTNNEITYHVYKVFNATSNGTSSAIAYQIDSVNGPLSAAMTAAGFSVDSAGNVSFSGTMDPNGNPNATDAALNAIAAYATDEIGTGFKAKPSDGTLTITGLEYGYYYITTSTGTAITVDSTNPIAQVQDKNTIPGKPDKKIVSGKDFIGSLDEAGQNALAQVGSKVYFKVTIKKVKGATNYVFHDVMDAGLRYNNDVAVNPAAVVDNTTTASGDTVTVTFKNDELAKLADNTDITITYSATVTSAALQTDPANNTAKLDYGNGHTTDMDQVSVYNAKFSVVKYDSTDASTTADDTHTVAVTVGDTTTYYAPLTGAGVVIANADGDYYKIENNVVSWVDSIDDATEFTSTATGALNGEFTGLVNGTYTLIEKTVPAGYNKAADSTFTIDENDYEVTNLIQSSNVGNASGTELPSTGGIGTTIFYIIGAVLVIGAGVILVTRRRMNAN